MDVVRVECYLFMFAVTFCTVVTGDFCARFVFPTIQSNVVTAQENATVEFPFRLDTTNRCVLSDNFQITVTQTDKNSPHKQSVYCQIYINGGVCKSNNERGCRCMQERGVYMFSKPLLSRWDTSIGTTWLWEASGGVAEKREIEFYSPYPPRITALTVDPRPLPFIPENTRVDIACFWENGNPPVKARLLDRHGKELSSSYKSGQIAHRFPTVRCQDAGPIRCEAPGSSQNLTTNLEVKCPPKFNDDNLKVFIGAGQPLELSLHVNSLNTGMTRCLPHRRFTLNGTHVDTRSMLTRFAFCNLTGIPPNLTLYVRLDNLRKEEAGQWRLELANDMGTDYLDFTLEVTGKDPEVPTTTPFFGPPQRWTDHPSNTVTQATSARDTGDNLGAIIGGVVGVVVIITVAVVVVLVVMKRRKATAEKRRKSTYQYPLGNPDRVLMRPVASLAVGDSRFNMGGHLVRDLVTQQVEFIPGDELPIFHSALPTHPESDEDDSDLITRRHVRCIAPPVTDRPPSIFSLTNYRLFRVGRNLYERVRNRSSALEPTTHL